MKLLINSMCLLWLLLLAPVVLHAQTNYQPGYVVTLEGDTLRGYINYKEWLHTPATVTFKENLNSGTEKEFSPANVRYFEITGMEAYQRYEGMITMNPVANDRVTFESKMMLEPVVVFLKVNYKGGLVDFLSYTDKIKDRFFFQEKDGSKPQELYYHRYYATSNSSNITTQKGYIGQLQFLATKYEVSGTLLPREIEAALYNKSDLEKVFRKIDETRAPVPEMVANESRSIRYFAGIGVNRSVVRMRDLRGFVGEPDSNPVSYMPLVSFGFDTFVNRHIRKLYLRLEGTLTAANYHVEREVVNQFGQDQYSHTGFTQYSYKFNQLNAAINPQVIYSLYNKDDFKFYVGGVGQFIFSKYPENHYRVIVIDTDHPSMGRIENYPEFRYMSSFWFSYAFRTGAVLKNRYEVYALYSPYSAISGYTDATIKVKSAYLGVNYLFAR